MMSDFNNKLEQLQESEYHSYMSWLLEQVRSVSPEITIDEFTELINLDGWDLENYIISRNIVIREEQDLEWRIGKDWKKKLYVKWCKFLESGEV
jgi:hypothetical protein